MAGQCLRIKCASEKNTRKLYLSLFVPRRNQVVVRKKLLSDPERYNFFKQLRSDVFLIEDNPSRGRRVFSSANHPSTRPFFGFDWSLGSTSGKRSSSVDIPSSEASYKLFLHIWSLTARDIRHSTRRIAFMLQMYSKSV
uniref:Uncharacterized protein n=1 Tax=Panagrellus redivivus TaxID=6233 RepID=A0A7E4W9E1_PANRE